MKTNNKQTPTNTTPTTQIPHAVKELLKVSTAKQAPDLVLTSNNILEYAERATLKTLSVVYAQSGNPYILTLFKQTVTDILYHNMLNYVIKDGYDLVQASALFLCDYIGHNISDLSNVENTKGERLTIYSALYKTIHAILRENRKYNYQRVYLDRIIDNENGNAIGIEYITVPFKWDIDSIADLDFIADSIDKMNLTATQLAVLDMRLQGYTAYTIAKRRGRDIKTIKETITQIAKKYCNLYGLDLTK